MSTQPQAPVALAPATPTRRNAELVLLCFATFITVVALLIVEANQEQGISWDLASSTLAFLTLFVCAHLAIRRFAPYADPVLLPVVALLNGLGLVMIHRLDLIGGAIARNADQAKNSRCCGRWSACSVSRWWSSSSGPSHPGPLRLYLRSGRPRAAGDPGAAAQSLLRDQRCEDLDSAPRLQYSARRVLQDTAADLLRRGAGGQARPVHQRR